MKSTTVPVVSNWLFDPAYGAEPEEGLIDALQQSVIEWVTATCPGLRRELKRSNRKSALVAQVSETSHEVDGRRVWMLKALVCQRGHFLPTECTIVVGSESFIEGQRRKLMTQVKEPLAAPGIEATMVEEDLSNQSKRTRQ